MLLYRFLTVLQNLSFYSLSWLCLCSLSTCSHTPTDLILSQFEYMLAKTIHFSPPYFVSVPADVFCNVLALGHLSRACSCLPKTVYMKNNFTHLLSFLRRNLFGKYSWNNCCDIKNPSAHLTLIYLLNVTDST